MSISLIDVAIDRGATRILESVSADFTPGTFTALIGPNGSGKSTLLRGIAGLSDYEGRIAIDNIEVRDLPRKKRTEKLAFVAQYSDIDTNLKVVEMVTLGRLVGRGLWTRATTSDQAKVEEALIATDLLDLAHRPWNHLSGGERQRVQVARAFAQESECLVLDEPTNHLDLHHQHVLLTLLRQLATEQNVCVVAALHDLDLAARYCDNVVVLYAGGVHATGRPYDVLQPELLREVFSVEAGFISSEEGTIWHCFGATGK